MRLHRFYIPETIGARTEIELRSKDAVDQIRRVFRLRTGDEIILFDGSGSEHTCAIASFAGDDRAVLDVRSSARARFTPSRKLWLFTAIVKKDNFETIVEKATELGVTDVVPVLAERTEKKAVNMDRLKKISVEASEQSGRGDVPVIHDIKTLKECVAWTVAQKGMASVAFHTDGDRFEQDSVRPDAPLAVFIGPEGGWSPDEVAMFHENKIAIRSLGPQVLRAETAVVAALSQVVFAP